MRARGQEGFTLVELMVTLVISVFVLAAASQMFASLLTQFKQQGKVAETSIESAVGLEILRRDLSGAGFGLPWDMSGATYLEATGTDPGAFNDSTGDPPRAIVANSPAFTVNGSDYLVIKSASVARNASSGKWTTLASDNTKRTWTPATENLAGGDRVVVVAPAAFSNSMSLACDGDDCTTGDFFAVYSGTSGFEPPDKSETRVIYGINDTDPANDTDPRMPFNRADYYISSSGVPARCAPGTGVLVKAVLDNDDSGNGGDFDLDNDGSDDELPLLDCVADMQAVFRLSTGAFTDDISALSAGQIRDQVREARIYVLAHEGQKDPSYTHPSSTIYVGETSIGSGRSFDLSAQIGGDWANYRWRVYAVVEKPENLR